MYELKTSISILVMDVIEIGAIRVVMVVQFGREKENKFYLTNPKNVVYLTRKDYDRSRYVIGRIIVL